MVFFKSWAFIFIRLYTNKNRLAVQSPDTRHGLTLPSVTMALSLLVNTYSKLYKKHNNRKSNQ